MRLPISALILAAWCLSQAAPALAHSFNVALVIPMSGQSKVTGQQIADGFMLATQERDNHPDNEADGHLGGLDVYVHKADNQANSLGKLKSILQQQSIDIIVSVGTDESTGAAIAAMAGDGTIVLSPGRLPQDRAGFRSAFQAAYGYEATEMSARGYNEARRIDAAIRPLDSVDDKTELRRRLGRTAITFSW
ncbi:MAG: hypothetical protein OER56_01190 [Hyphomicrobiales bacterium]|nr:hypothetical protein [Hyphomicrobiales bacterium]